MLQDERKAGCLQLKIAVVWKIEKIWFVCKGYGEGLLFANAALISDRQNHISDRLSAGTDESFEGELQKAKDELIV